MRGKQQARLRARSVLGTLGATRVDLERARAPRYVRVAPPERQVFGQVLQLMLEGGWAWVAM